jgi:hypothetical protein
MARAIWKRTGSLSLFQRSDAGYRVDYRVDEGTATRLEEYLREAAVLHVRPLEGGGGHSDKAALILEGAVGVVAKRADGEPMQVQARREVAAWVLAVELGMSHLVPATVLRWVPVGDDIAGEQVEASVQVLWPRFSPALVGSVQATDCDESISWSIAVFDLLIANTDRNGGNWGTIEGRPRAVFIDHGHAFAAADSNSPFVERHRNADLPTALCDRVKRFHAAASTSRLKDFVDEPVCAGVQERAAKIARGKLDIR